MAEEEIKMIKQMKKNTCYYAVCLFLTFTICIYAPFELYLTNQSEFWFSLSLIWWIPLSVFIAAEAIVLLIGKLPIRKNLYEALLFSAAVCFYIQGNFLNLDVGVMNGAEIDWKDYSGHIAGNLIIWFVIFAVIMYISIYKEIIFEKIAGIISAFLTLIQLVSLIVLLVVSWSGGMSKSTTNFVSDKNLYEVGSNSNVIVFLLDMYDDEYFKTLLADDPQLKENLDGFTYFSNHTGSYSTTSYSLSHLSTGKICHNEADLHEWMKNVSEDRLYLDELRDAGYRFSIYTDMTGCFPERYIKDSENYLEAPLKISNTLHFTFDLYQLVVLKYFPDVFKSVLWMDGTEFNYWKSVESDYNVYIGDNLGFKNGLEEKGIKSGGDQKEFKFIHLNGTHYPYTINEFAEPVAEDSVTAEECAKGVMNIVEEYLNELKQNGVYDNTAIVMVADHGYYWDGTLTNPVLLVKPREAHGELTVNEAPVCQRDFGATILDLAGVQTGADYGRSVFEIPEGSQRDRYFYQYYLMERCDRGEIFRLIEYKAASETNNPALFELTDVEYTINGNKIQHSKYCSLCKGEEEYVQSEYDPPRIVHHKSSNYPDD